MNHDLICSWLGLPPGEWPPDHYRLLGLEPGEDNAEVIEQHVHERLDSVRRYQMIHPEQATEAMNRLAQAFVCLMEPALKKAYDTALLGAAPSAQSFPSTLQSPQLDTLTWFYSQPQTSLPVDPLSIRARAGEASPVTLPVAPPLLSAATILNYETAPPPPLRQPPPLPTLPPLLNGSESYDAREAILPSPAAESTPSSEPVDPVLEAAQSGPARRGIGTKRALYYRVARTRQMIRAWTGLGKYLRSSKRRLNRATEGPDMVRQLEEITELIKGFPPLLGEAGQPGYLVLALTQVDTIKVFQSFSAHQREALTRDWRAGVKLLLAHRDFLRQELRALRRRTFGRRLVRATVSLITDQPGTVLLLLALLAINIALWRTYAEALWEKLFSH